MLTMPTTPAAQASRLLTPTQLGSRMREHLSAQLINRWLLSLGWQRKHAFQGYEPCGCGLEYGRVVERKWRDPRTGQPLTSRVLQWSADCVPVLEYRIANGVFK